MKINLLCTMFGLLTMTFKNCINTFDFAFAPITNALNVSGAGVSTCSKDTCANQGTCLKSISTSGHVCDCDLTSFTGPRCSDGKMLLFFYVKQLSDQN